MEELSVQLLVWDRRWVLGEPEVNYQGIEDSDRVGAWEGDLWRHENGNCATGENWGPWRGRGAMTRRGNGGTRRGGRRFIRNGHILDGRAIGDTMYGNGDSE